MTLRQGLTGISFSGGLARLSALLFLLALMLIPGTSAHAGGWHDYILDIGHGYLINRTEATGAYMATCGGRAIVLPGEHGTGPLSGYSTSERSLLLRHEGLKGAEEVFFIFDKEQNNLHGPFNEISFASELSAMGSNGPRWSTPRNPSLLAPVIATVMFLIISFPFIYYSFLYISLPLTIALAYIAYRAYRARAVRGKEA